MDKLKANGDDYDHLLKVVLVGDSGVGKSCLLKRFATSEWDPTYISTIGVDFEILTLNLVDKTVRLQIWDTAGQERFHNITTSYYRGANAIMIVYDVTNGDSFKNVRKWLEAVTTYASADVSILLVGNKCDLTDARQISWHDSSQYAESLHIPHIETSAKTGVEVENAFRTLAENAVKILIEKQNKSKNGIKIDEKKKI